MRCFTATDGESAWQILTSASVEMGIDLVSPFGMSQSHPSSIGRRWVVSRPCAAVCAYVAAQVLLDIVLPDISGVELLQRIRDSDNEVGASPLHVRGAVVACASRRSRTVVVGARMMVHGAGDQANRGVYVHGF